jgi:hypothetical protein
VIQPLAGAILLRDRLHQLLVGDEAPLNEDAANTHVSIAPSKILPLRAYRPPP